MTADHLDYIKKTKEKKYISQENINRILEDK